MIMTLKAPQQIKIQNQTDQQMCREPLEIRSEKASDTIVSKKKKGKNKL
jgi:hypothetical protein